MTLLMPYVAARIFNTPLMIDAGKAAAILTGIGGRIVDGGIRIDGAELEHHVAFANGRPSMGRIGDPLGATYEAQGAGERLIRHMVDGVAVIAVEGTLVHKGKFLGSLSGDTSYEGLQAQVSRARRDPRVKAAVFEVDSFGGEVSGAFDTADMIATLSAEKPTLAILTDHALSAGYLLASAARAIVLPDTGYAGSIGVVTMHVDYSKRLEQKGITVTVLASGAHKADSSPFAPLADDVKARIQGEIDAGRDLFAATVARYRGGRLTKAAALATEARSLRGKDAQRAGLVDGVMRPSEAFDAFVTEVNRNGARGRAS